MSSPGGSSEMSTQELLDAQAHIYNHMFSFANSMSLKCAIELSIPDAIRKHGKPMTLSELGDALPINKDKSHALHHLMPILTHSKFFHRIHTSKDDDEEEAYCLTRASRLLARDEPMNLGKMVLFASDPIVMGTWHHEPGDMLHDPIPQADAIFFKWVLHLFSDRIATETKLFFDMQMVVQFATKQRTEKEWANIFHEASFGNYKITPTVGLRSIIEVFP